MLNIRKILLMTVIPLAASGCSGGTAKCNDDYSKQGVISVIESNLQFSASLVKDGKLINSQISGVKTTERDEKLDTYMCEATYKFDLDGESQEYPVRYELSYMEDEKRTSVAVYGVSQIDKSIAALRIYGGFMKQLTK